MSIETRFYSTVLASALLMSFLHGDGGQDCVLLGLDYSLDDDPGLCSCMSIGIALSPPFTLLLLTLTTGVLARLVLTTTTLLFTLFAQFMAALHFVRNSLTFSLGALVLFGPFDCCFGWLALNLAARHTVLVWSMCITNTHWVVLHLTLRFNLWAHTFVENISQQQVHSPAAELLAMSILVWLSFFKSEPGIHCVCKLWRTVNPCTYKVVQSPKLTCAHPIPALNYQEIHTELSIEANTIATMKCREIPEVWMRMSGGWSAHHPPALEATLVRLIDNHPDGKGLRGWLEMRKQNELAWDLYRTGRKAVQAIPGALDIQGACLNSSAIDTQATANSKALTIPRTLYHALSKLLQPLWRLLVLLRSPGFYPWIRVSHLSPTDPPQVTNSQSSPQTSPSDGLVSNNPKSRRPQRTLFNSSSDAVITEPTSEAPTPVSRHSLQVNQPFMAIKLPRITPDVDFSTQDARHPLCHRRAPYYNAKPVPAKPQLPNRPVGPSTVIKEPPPRPSSEAQATLSGSPHPLPIASTSIRPDGISTGHPHEDDLQVFVPVSGFDEEVAAITSSAPSIDTHLSGKNAVLCAKPAASYKGNVVYGALTETDTHKTTHLVVRSGHLADRSVHPYRRIAVSRVVNNDKDELLDSLLFAQCTVSLLVSPFSWMSIKDDDPDTEMDLDVDMVGLDQDQDEMDTPDTTMSSSDSVDLDTFDRPTSPLLASTGVLLMLDWDAGFGSTPRASTPGYTTPNTQIWSTSSPQEQVAAIVTTTPTTTPPAPTPWFQQAPVPDAPTWDPSGSSWTTPVFGSVHEQGSSYWNLNEVPCADQTWASLTWESTWTSSPRQVHAEDTYGCFVTTFESTTPPWTPGDKKQPNDQHDDWQSQELLSDTFTSPLAATLNPNEAPWTINSFAAGDTINAAGYGIIVAKEQLRVDALAAAIGSLRTSVLPSSLAETSDLQVIIEVSEDEDEDRDGEADEEEQDEPDAVEDELGIEEEELGVEEAPDTEDDDYEEGVDKPEVGAAPLFAQDYALADVFLTQMQGEGLLGHVVST